MDESVEVLYPNASADVLAIIARLRTMVTTAAPEATEVFCHGALGYGPSASGFDRIIYITAQNGYANLGFFFGANLPDPAHLLEGSGKRMRHIKVRTVQDAEEPALRQLVRNAWVDGVASVAQLHAATRSRARS